MPPVLLSIVTPCLNRRDTIAEAVESVLSQSDADGIEHIVIDGGSTDGTLDVLARYSHLTVITEPDRGLYDAINKGLRIARGEIIGHLNSDDLYAVGALRRVIDAFAADSSIETVCGGAEIFVDDSDGVRTTHVFDDDALKLLRPRDLIHGVPITNARFFRRTLYERVGDYDLRYPIAADRDFLMRVLVVGARRTALPGIVYRYRSHAGSLTMQAGAVSERVLREYVAIAVDRWREHVKADGPPRVQALYRRWHAWASAALLRARLRAGHGSIALREMAAAAARDPIWPVRVVPQLLERQGWIGG